MKKVEYMLLLKFSRFVPYLHLMNGVSDRSYDLNFDINFKIFMQTLLTHSPRKKDFNKKNKGSKN